MRNRCIPRADSGTVSDRFSALRRSPGCTSRASDNAGCAPVSPGAQTAQQSERETPESPGTPARKLPHPLPCLTCPSLPKLPCHLIMPTVVVILACLSCMCTAESLSDAHNTDCRAFLRLHRHFPTALAMIYPRCTARSSLSHNFASWFDLPLSQSDRRKWQGGSVSRAVPLAEPALSQPGGLWRTGSAAELHSIRRNGASVLSGTLW